MLTIHRCQGLVGLIHRETFRVEWDGSTAGELISRYRDRAWCADAPVCAIGSCDRYQPDDVPLPGAHVVIAPDPGLLATAIFIGQVLLATAISIGIQALIGPPEIEVGQGDASSPNYGFTGVGTSYGSGFRVPIWYGQHRVNGHVVSTSVSPIDDVTLSETIAQVIVLSEGPVYEIGGLRTPVSLVTAPSLANPSPDPFPEGITVDGIAIDGLQANIDEFGPDVFVSTRMGAVVQPPMVGFEEPTAVTSVNGELRDLDSEIIGLVPTILADYVRVQIDFAAGLYTQAGGGPASTPAAFTVRWRHRSTQPIEWSAAPSVDLVAPQPPVGRTDAFSIHTTIELSRAPAGTPDFTGYEVLVRRTTPAGANTGTRVFVDAAIFRRMVHGTRRFVGYPRRALLGVKQRGTERFQGSRPQYSIPGKWRTVRVWDAEHGVSAREYWDVPEAGDDFAGIWTHPPGRNPAWIAVDLLTRSYGLGNRIHGPGTKAEDHIDWPAWRDFADYCDQDISGRALHSCDIGFDDGADAWSVIQAVCKVGRGSPMPVGRMISVRYQYRDAHGRGTNVVPARARVDVVNTSNVTDFALTYLPIHERANVMVAQFLNEAKNYELDEVPREDPNASLSDLLDPLRDVARRQAVPMFGITNLGEIRREMEWRQNITRLADRQVSFKCAINQLAIEPGDIIGVEHDAYPREAEAPSPRFFRAGLGRTVTPWGEITADREMSFPTTGSFPATWVQPDGTVYNGVIQPPATGVLVQGEELTIVPDGMFRKGTAVTIGPVGGVATEDYVVTRVSIDDEHMLQVEALLWTPDAYSTTETAT